MTLSRPDEAMPHARRALELDPFNPLFHSLYGVDFLYVGQWDEAIAQARTALSTAPDDALANGLLWYAFGAKGMHKEALASARVYLKGTYGDRAVDEALERGFAEVGYQGAMRRAAEPLVAHFHRSYVNPIDIVSLYVEAGETSGRGLAREGLRGSRPEHALHRMADLRQLALRRSLPVPSSPHESPSRRSASLRLFAGPVEERRIPARPTGVTG